MKKFQQGFTLIELMIVVAIIGILAAIAIPQYNDYTAKSQASECYSLLDGLKTPLQEAHAQDSAIWSIPAGSVTSGKYVSSISAVQETPVSRGGTLACGFTDTNINAKVKGQAVSLRYNISRAQSPGGSWSCQTSVPIEIKPRSCTGTLDSF